MDEFIQSIYTWYNTNQRDLPWRRTSDPYKIWISETILQQTRIEQGKAYYLKFIEKFPDCSTLASASEDQVLKLWQGLGYYSRARNLHASAKVIHARYNGSFPKNYKDILSLKGVGSYTAAAVASIAFGQPYPVLDGNVIRVLARYLGIFLLPDSAPGKKKFHEAASALMNPDNPGFHNQSLMEFGALKCTPKNPGCGSCPVASSCYASLFNKVDNLPVKSKKITKRTRYMYFFLIEHKDNIYIGKRTGNDIWKNLYHFPVIETQKELHIQDINLIPSVVVRKKYELQSISTVQKHVLTHQVIHARLIYIKIFDILSINEHYFKIKFNQIHNYALPRLIEKMIEKSKISKFYS